jgi:transcriptional regulator with XRE-family HTH domain
MVPGKGIMLSHRLRTLRRSRGLSQIDLAEKAGLSQSYLSRLEQGVLANPSSSVLERLADALGVHVALLYGQPDGAENGKRLEGISVSGEVNVANGSGGEVRTVNSDMLVLPESLTAYRIREEGLVPGAGPGAHLLVVPSESPADGDLVVIRRGDRRWLRRVFRKPGQQLLLIPAGAESDSGLPPGTYGESEVEFEGRVRGIVYPPTD